MTIVCRPIGRGNWAPLEITLTGKHAGVFAHMWGFQVGQRFDLGGITWRVVAVLP